MEPCFVLPGTSTRATLITAGPLKNVAPSRAPLPAAFTATSVASAAICFHLARHLPRLPRGDRRRGVASRATHEDRKKVVGHVTNIGPEGKKRLRPGAQHLSPLAPAKEMPFPSAASAHRDGYADPEDRGHRFDLLPPPPDRPYLSHQGSLQPALRSRLDVTTDIRFEGSMGSVLPKTADTVCLVPEPHLRVLRPDQRQRSTAALADTQEMTSILEKEGRWHQPLRPEQVDMESLERFSRWSDDELRTRLMDCAELVSGSRVQLMERLTKKRRRDMQPWTMWTKKEVEQECLRSGLPVHKKKSDNVQTIEDAEVRNREAELSNEDLYFELCYRKLPYSHSREENEQRLRTALTGLGRPW